MIGFEWPGPGRARCGAEAEDRVTGEHISCLLKRGHNSPEHHWEAVSGETLRSATWLGVGYVTVIGQEPNG